MLAIDHRIAGSPRLLHRLQMTTAGHQILYSLTVTVSRTRIAASVTSPAAPTICRHDLIDLIQRRDLCRRLLAAQHSKAVSAHADGCTTAACFCIVHHYI